MSEETYNIVVIGGGAAGLVTSYIAAAVNAKVVLIEKNKMGGDCLNTGCVPSKALIRTSRLISEIKRHKEFGLKSVEYEFEFKDVMARVHDIIKAIEPHDSVERYTELGVECIYGDAEIIDKNTVRVGDRVLKTKNIVLAMGAKPFVPPIEGLEEVKYLTSDNLWDLTELPANMIILGGGPIGCEMSQAFSRLGSNVTQIEMGTKILGREDDDVSKIVSEQMEKDGVNVLTETMATGVIVDGDRKKLRCVKDGEELFVDFDEIFIAVGRKARTEGVDWEKLGIKLRKNGTVEVDKFMRANGSNIYAAGDLTGPYQFTHMASHQAWFCAVNALFKPFKKFKVDYSVIPWVTYTDPEIAQVGMNEKAAKEKGIAYEVTSYGIGDLDRAITESCDRGKVKVLTVPGKDKILGATIVSHQAGELITEFVTAMKHNHGLNDILGTIHAYPTMSEANKYVAGNWKKSKAPEKILKMLEKFHKWRRK